MKALAGFAVCAAVAAFAVGCDNHDSQTPLGAAPADTFVGSSFGPAPTNPGYVVPASPPSDNHGNGTLGSSTGSHELDTKGGNP